MYLTRNSTSNTVRLSQLELIQLNDDSTIRNMLKMARTDVRALYELRIILQYATHCMPSSLTHSHAKAI